MNQSILIVEDEEKIARLLEIELEFEGYQVSKEKNGIDGLETYCKGSWDLVLLDIMIPGLNGIELLRRIRKHDANVPVILLTAKSSIADKVEGLDLGANDYVTKPFVIEELLARVRVALRVGAAKDMTSQVVDQWLSAGDLRLHEGTREVLRGEHNIELTPREFDLLVHLLRHQRQVLSREQLLENVWGIDYIGDTNVVDVYIRYVRNKIDPSRQLPELIHTVRGIGYVLKESL
ncbi:MULTISPECIES: response regulator transcription factor [Paenibacillus]|uniref:response regulator transcription factor n=1 Tax=Paenibacillus TaxID=44249 RepID=UPI0002E2EB0E|nr:MULTISPECIES: response regulator transcription factor [Paenibacillus]KJD37700.1 PhoB family transcriptional regulator [Paenibacillus polymyxa]KKD55782.1 PhoB family transcriptional regulator [Paenibacillus sp. ICGEB2008]MDU8675215.1 response regulator transcription factor [Paenibacillus polymyxa]MDU8700122.1 response regulator transcription factor [Paenibacillus polymyxa]UQQ36788.1 response regulator transcription factor [Paenibacillus polymyxa]